jgi:TATA-box binding protein (TBP) (component of TFIID and TFIIIB)
LDKFFPKNPYKFYRSRTPMMANIQNCTITFSLGHRFQQREYLWLARNGWNLEYDPRRFHAIIMRLRHHYNNNNNTNAAAATDATAVESNALHCNALDSNAVDSTAAASAVTNNTVTALVFSSGRVVMTGLRWPEAAERVAWMVCRQLQRTALLDGGGGDGEDASAFGPRLHVTDVRVRNIVGARAISIVTQWGRRPDPPRLRLPLVARTLSMAGRHRAPASSIALCNTGMGDRDPDALVTILPLRVSYEPCLFPALNCRFQLLKDPSEETAAAAAGTCLLFTSGKMIVTGMRATGDVAMALDGWDRLLCTYPSNEEMLKYIIFP